MRTSGAGTLVVVLAVFVSACLAESPTPTTSPSASAAPDYVWLLIAGDLGARRLLVFDDADLLQGISRDPFLPVNHEDVWWDPIADDPDSIAMGWLGGVCVDPTLTILQTGEQTVLSLFEGTSAEECPAVGVAYTVVLTFGVPVATLDLSARMSHPGAP